jgi:hypothetical protein
MSDQGRPRAVLTSELGKLAIEIDAMFAACPSAAPAYVRSISRRLEAIRFQVQHLARAHQPPLPDPAAAPKAAVPA